MENLFLKIPYTSEDKIVYLQLLAKDLVINVVKLSDEVIIYEETSADENNQIIKTPIEKSVVSERSLLTRVVNITDENLNAVSDSLSANCNDEEKVSLLNILNEAKTRNADNSDQVDLGF